MHTRSYIALVLALATLCTSVLSKELDSSVLWDRYQETLLSFIKKTNDPNQWTGLQVVTDPLEANWEDDETILNLQMNQASRFGSFYEPTSLLFSEQYEKYLYNFDLSATTRDSNARNELRRLSGLVREAERKRSDEDIQCRNDYSFFKTIIPNAPTFETFAKQQCPTLNVAHSDLVAISSLISEQRSRVNGPNQIIIDALMDFNMEVSPGQYTESGSLTLSKFLNNARSRKGVPTSFALKSSTHFDEKRTWIYKKKSGFIFKKSKTTTKVERRIQSEQFEMRIEAESFGAIRISPKGKWFNFNLVRQHGQSNKNLWVDKSRNFFGASGTIPLLPKTVYVVYNPSVILEVSEADGLFFQENTQSSFSFGPIASAKGSTLTVNKITNNKYRVEFRSNNQAAQILAVDNFVL